MILLSTEQRRQLRANAVVREMHARRGWPEPDHCPVVKFFNPLGAATWLATELDRDGETLFGLADLGFGCPELGSFSLFEISLVRLPHGLKIERDEDFQTAHPLSLWAEAARRSGSIIGAQAALAATPPPPSN
nr:DUF2958 domain-containing protein [Sphingomonas sp. Y57]